MTQNTFEMTFRVRWWVYPFLFTVTLFARMFGCVPDIERVGKFVADHGLKLETKP